MGHGPTEQKEHRLWNREDLGQNPVFPFLAAQLSETRCPRPQGCVRTKADTPPSILPATTGSDDYNTVIIAILGG